MRIVALALLICVAAFAAEPESSSRVVSPQIATNGVIFRYLDAQAFSVSVTGDFNQWSINSHLLERDKSGMWSLLVPLKPGKYQYQFNVNGIYWKQDPHNPNKVTDGYGGVKSMVEVPETIPTSFVPRVDSSGTKETPFSYLDPLAKKVAVGGFFNNWSQTANAMTNDSKGTWSGVVQLKPGNHAYKFWVDGKWILDPANPVTVADGRGGSNSVVNVGN